MGRAADPEPGTKGGSSCPLIVGDRLGGLVGAGPGQVVVGDSTSVCLYKLACAALDLRPGRREIVTDVDNFPTDRYVLEGLARERGLSIVWLEFDPVLGPTVDEVASVVNERTALVSFSHVSYRSAFIADMAGDHAAGTRRGGSGVVGSEPHRRLGARGA